MRGLGYHQWAAKHLMHVSAMSTLEIDSLARLCARERPVSEIASLTGFGRTKVRKALKRMAETGLVEVTGSDRGTKYQVIR